MSGIVFQSKITVISVIPTFDPLVWDIVVSVIDGEGMFSGTDVQIGDVVVLDTSGYETGTLTRYAIMDINSQNFSEVSIRVVYEPTNTNSDQNVDLNYTVGYDGIICRPSKNYRLLPVIAPSVQQMSDRFTVYLQNYNFSSIVDNIVMKVDIPSLTEFEPTPITVGGIPAGSTFNSTPLVNIIHDLLYPYQVPAYTTFAIEDQETLLEVGRAVAGGPRTFVWDTVNEFNVVPGTIEIRDLTNNNTPLLLYGENDGVETINCIEVRKVNYAQHIWKLTGRGTNNVTFSKYFTVTWQWRVYYGSSIYADFDELRVKALQNSRLETSGTGIYEMPPGGYKWIVCTIFHPILTVFKDIKTGLNVPMMDPIQVTVTNAWGVTSLHNAYRTLNKLGAEITISAS